MQVRIDRVTGKIFVKSVSDGGKKNMSVRIDYSGDCEAFKNTNKFWSRYLEKVWQKFGNDLFHSK